MRDFESKTLLEYRFSFQDMLMWPFIRWTFMSSALERNFGFSTTNAPAPIMSGAAKAAYLFSVWKHRPTAGLRPFDVLWFTSAIGVVVQKAGKWFGRVNDYLVALHPEGSLVIENSHEKKFKLPRAVPHIRFHDYLRVRAAALAKLSGGASDSDRKRIGELIGRIRRTSPIPLEDTLYASMESALIALAAKLPHLHSGYARLFRETRPKILFLEDASYGGQSYLIKWAKQAGIKTAEFQHGVVVPAHLAYNFGEAAFEPPYREYLPDFLLTHGAFWSGNARMPAAKVEIGNPHFSTKLEESAKNAPGPVKRRLLIVSQADVTEWLVRLTLEIAAAAPDLNIVFRLHPAEAAFEDRYRSLQGVSGITISKSGDIYELIHSSEWIVGVSSTVLFEAAGLRKPVFVYDTPQAALYIPRNFGTWFRDVPDLLALISASGAEAAGSDRIWAGNWADNFRRFLKRETGLEIAAASGGGSGS